MQASQKQTQRRVCTANETHLLQATPALVKTQTRGCHTIKAIRTSIRSTSQRQAAPLLVIWVRHHRDYPTIAHREITTSKHPCIQAGNGSKRTHPSLLRASRSKKKSRWANHNPTKTLLCQNRCSNRLVLAHDTGVISSRSELR